MKFGQTTKQTLQTALNPLEVLTEQVGKGVAEEAMRELGGFFGSTQSIGTKPREIASADLQKARKQEEIKTMEESDNEKSRENAMRIQMTISEYNKHDAKTNNEQKEMKAELNELKNEIVKLANISGVETNVHLENTPNKIGLLDLKRLTAIIRFLRSKAEDSKSAKDMVTARTAAKPATGMMAWVSGKQGKIYEQGTLTLQG